MIAVLWYFVGVYNISDHYCLFLSAVDLPTDIEMSKVVADLEYVLADCCGLGDDADVTVDNNMACSSSAVNKVWSFCVMLVKSYIIIIGQISAFGNWYYL